MLNAENSGLARKETEGCASSVQARQ
jgi:hypothetical protein